MRPPSAGKTARAGNISRRLRLMAASMFCALASVVVAVLLDVPVINAFLMNPILWAGVIANGILLAVILREQRDEE